MPRKSGVPINCEGETVVCKDPLCGVRLTKREHQVLLWVAQGKSSWEIGHIILCQECTVNFHCRNIMGKLNVRTRGHALLKAVSLGLIVP
jgi:DNA-binding CsgD family transcriptional regulator